ncbi:MAG: threonine/serine dehydratase [Pseudomonadota bacterium]
METLPTRDDVTAAVDALRDVAVETPLVRVRSLEERIGAASVYVKLETMQRTGSFKFRGAYWRCLHLSAEERKRGVVAYSSGNFAQGLAAASQLLQVPCTIVMPHDAPEVKRLKTERYGAVVVQTDHGDRPREEVANEEARHIATREGRVLLHPFDDPALVTGHASLAIEVLEELNRWGAPAPDDLLCCVGGGGLFAGISLGLRVSGMHTSCIPCEPLGYDSFRQSLRVGKPVRVGGSGATLCDALQATRPGDAPFAIAGGATLGEPATVDDAAVRDAMRFAHDALKVVLEPSGAVALAALLNSRDRFEGRHVVVVLTGGNIEIAAFGRLAA